MHSEANDKRRAPLRVMCITSQAASITNVRPEAAWFIGLQKAGVEMTVMTEPDSDWVDEMRGVGIDVVGVNIRSKFDWAAIKRIRKTLREGRHQVMHMFNNKAIVNGIAASVGLPVKVVTYRGQTGNIKRYDPTCYLTHLNPRVAKITCVADAVRKDLIANGVSPNKVVTIYKGHDLAWYEGVEPEDLAPLGVPDDAFAVACVANNRPRKGVPVLIDSAGFLPSGTKLHFLLVGGGMTSDEIRRLIDASPLPDHFHPVGYRDEVLPLVAACSAGVLPATKREGLPKTVIEAMALELPVVVTRTGGSPELITDGECGFVVEPSDPRGLAEALQKLADDPATAWAMGAAARARLAGHFDVAQGVAAHARLYEELAGEID
ncbi:MAG: glycosyltransferase [Gammaproteobacteria bacterium]|nr:glycosyltransferase [Gammaproteobacteria bacterium]MBT8445029.1 glycosyltransferase [Gammaproteobacteria bacterium]NND37917.1 glycosyltransferase [Gammaproteobacteria bacterium]